MNDQARGAVLITGARGFIGRAVGKLLRREGYRVVSIDVEPAKGETSGAREVECDITDEVCLRSVFESEQIGGIVHLAAILPTAARSEPLRATKVNVEGSLHLLEMARRFGARRVVFGSSLSVYGTVGGNRAVSELDRSAPEDLYGAAKLYVEQLGDAYRRSSGIEFASLRIGRVVGEGARSATSAWRSEIFEFLRVRQPTATEIPYAKTERVLLVHVGDVATMLATLLRAPEPAHCVYNACCESMSVGELKQEVERLNPNVEVRLGGERVEGNPQELDSSRFASEFGFRSIPISERMAETAREGSR